ncbi:MAG: DUF882 domain-containing protein [Rhodobacteraceae bacterium]|nr:DUF882 domain-containing protein [Paracoccaceae bacterium]
MTESTLTRRAVLRVFAAGAVTAAPVMANAFGFLRGSGDIRKLCMCHSQTGESLNIIYWIDGDYIGPALDEVNHFMRDWRQDEVRAIDRRTLDIMAAAHNLLDTSDPYTLLSGYRSPATNAMLRARSRAVARDSRHITGEAADVRVTSRSVAQIAQAAVTCRAGGVGRYSGSNFVHMDCGPVRTWGR